MFDLAANEARLAELSQQAAAPELWNDNEKAQAVLKEQARCKGVLNDFTTASALLDDAEAMLELAVEAEDEASASEAAAIAAEAGRAIERMEFARMLSGPNDRDGALLSINAGAGGTDAQDWAEMLGRMYLRWAERRGFKVELLDRLAGEEAGIKSMTIGVDGEYAYGYLRAEAGVHRLVRISPFDANARRQTAFAAVHVSPDIDDDVEVDIDDDDLKIDYYRAGGAGGQHVNKTESAVRITHLPSNIVVTCQNERSQHKNKSQAMRVLRARLYELELKKREEEMSEITGDKKSIEWGSQIRSYVLAPYRQVSDHRTELKVGNVDAVLDGDLDPFIQSYLLASND
ncbi:MAG: peptide chain release factor 2 [Deltaproteobacteria bacterium]|nr:MAG: peptide chain release factor 2 [Pseudomonadota bacterium]PIE66133.1 MAG: peptide chain release factor 2 [Deltaproteobacteria bacterium]